MKSLFVTLLLFTVVYAAQTYADEITVSFSGQFEAPDSLVAQNIGRPIPYSGHFVIDENAEAVSIQNYPGYSVANYPFEELFLKIDGNKIKIAKSDISEFGQGTARFAVQDGVSGTLFNDLIDILVYFDSLKKPIRPIRIDRTRYSVEFFYFWAGGSSSSFSRLSASQVSKFTELYGPIAEVGFSNTNFEDHAIDWTPVVSTDVTTRDRFGYPVGEGDCSDYALSSYRVEWDMNHTEIGPDGTTYEEHTGEDWNRGGSDADYGDPVCAIGDGKVIESDNFKGSWGNVIVIEHKLPGNKVRWSQYAHLKDRFVTRGKVKKGQIIGTIGDAFGKYSPHLHLEVRQRDVSPTNWPFDPNIYLDPSDIGTDQYPQKGFIESN